MLIGLTGGIGAGKSTVTAYLRDKGYPVLDADQVAREIVEPGTETLLLLSKEFGKEIIEKDGSLNRKKLAEIAFADVDRKKELDRIMHGKVIEILLSRGKAMVDEPFVFIDVPLLFESEMDGFMDCVWLVDADEETRINRVTQRDNSSRDQVLNRIRHQMTSEEKIKKSHVVLDNSHGIENLFMQIDEKLKELEEKEYDK